MTPNYFKLKPLIKKEIKRKLNNSELFHYVNELEKGWIQFAKKQREEFCNNLVYLNCLSKTEKNIRFVKHILFLANKFNQTIKWALKKYFNEHLKTKFCKSTFYNWLKILNKLIWKRKINFKYVVVKPTLQINKIYKYDNFKRFFIYKHHLKNVSLFKQSFVQTWLNLRTSFDEFKSLCLKTTIKILREYKEFSVLNKYRNQIKHKLRTHDICVGNTQMDIKVIGKKDSPTLKPIYIIDIIDEKTKFYYGELYENVSKEKLINFVHNAINYFKKYNLKILRIRTDHALVFKKTNFINTGEFNKLLFNFSIRHEYIAFGQPQCNGVIERNHRTIDNEFLHSIRNCKDIEQIKKLFAQFNYFFNFERWHHYSDIKDSYQNCFKKPIQLLNEINNKF